jgi:hypothetical protein
MGSGNQRQLNIILFSSSTNKGTQRESLEEVSFEHIFAEAHQSKFEQRWEILLGNFIYPIGS